LPASFASAAIAADANEAGKQGETVVTMPGPAAGFVKA
jgi:hypothetical protein